MKRGKYNLKRRAERQEETRLRITRATLELHETLGPSKTTISAIAERAGVGRPTVYSHFPDELSLGKACSSLGLAENPPPDPEPWDKISDPEQRLRVALTELYAYFHRRERLLANVLRDAEREWELNANVREIMKPMITHWERMKETLAAGWEVSSDHPQPLLGAIGVALDFETWHTMVRKQGLTDEQALDLMVGMVRCAMHS
jgi:AcrR family transcriptional regulator